MSPVPLETGSAAESIGNSSTLETTNSTAPGLSAQEGQKSGGDSHKQAESAIGETRDMEADKLYEERIEEEYAKREGGA
jgi:hypothetical protein